MKKRFENHVKGCCNTEESAAAFFLDDSVDLKPDVRMLNSQSLIKENEEQVYRCNNCPKEFRRLYLYENHIQNCAQPDHSSEYECEICKKGFATKHKLIYHRKSHPELADQDHNKYSCTECWRQFRLKSTLLKHVKEEHDDFTSSDSENEEAPSDDCQTPEIKVPSREEDGWFYCLSGDCKSQDVSFQSYDELHQHFFRNHIKQDPDMFSCQYCGKAFATEEIKNDHESVFHKFECTRCDAKLGSDEELAEHLATTHSDEVVFRCEFCVQEFYNKGALAMHIKQHHTEKYKCESCEKQFALKSSFDRHTQKHCTKTRRSRAHKPHMKSPKVDMPFKEENGRFFCLSGDCQNKDWSFQYINGLKEHYLDKHAADDLKKFSCQFCSKKFGTNGLRNKHEDLYHKQRFVCPQCKRKFVSSTVLSNHLKTHLGKKEFVCETCGSEFFNKGSLYTHIKDGHDKRYTCEECGQHFSLKVRYKDHMAKHPNSKEYKEAEEKRLRRKHFRAPVLEMPMREENGRFYCLTDDCVAKRQSFQYANGLKDHFMDKHATEEQKNFQCRYCGKMFGTNALKNKHQFMYHELKYECTLCEKKYGQKGMLDNHMRTHTGEKPFVCETCGAGFHVRGNLNKHIRETHTAKTMSRDHHCDQCGRAFLTSSTLKKHIRTVHSDVRAFVCEECGKNYKSNDALKSHTETHKGIKIPCQYCTLTFSTKSHYRRHCKRKHMKEQQQV
jgi:KRAB domain-containing zinc finger protein